MHGEQVSSSTFGGVRSDHAIEPNDLGAGQDLSYFGAASILSSCLLQPEGSTADLARVVPTLVAVRCAVAWPHSAVSHGEGVQCRCWSCGTGRSLRYSLMVAAWKYFSVLSSVTIHVSAPYRSLLKINASNNCTRFIKGIAQLRNTSLLCCVIAVLAMAILRLISAC